VSILVDSSSRVVVQGVTGREGAFHAARMAAAGTRVVGGTSPGKGGQTVPLDPASLGLKPREARAQAAAGVPVFDSLARAVAETGADVSVVFVPAPFARDALFEAADAGLRLVVCVTEGIPVRDMTEAVAQLRRCGVTLVGPNCPGVVSVGQCNAGITPNDIFTPGPVGLVSRSGTLTYHIVDLLSAAGLGQTTCVGMGGDPVHGVGFIECLELFERDPATRAVVMIGEIGGDDEERAAAFVRARLSKPVVAYLAGFTAPAGRQMGHAGAIISGSAGTAAAKAEALEAAGIPVARAPGDVPALVAAVLGQRWP
jgi:succinyl-CoA synthetase alpha subunit